MSTLHTLPFELLAHICELAERRDLWALVRTCTWLRRAGLGVYLGRLGVLRAHAEAGALTLPAAQSDAALLIVLAGHLRPLRRLIAFSHAARRPVTARTGFGYLALAGVLASGPPVPDVMVYNRHSNANAAWTTREALELLARMPAVADSLLLIVSAERWVLSRPRTTRPLLWWLPRRPVVCRPAVLPALFWGVPLLAAVLVTNIILLLLWAWDALAGPAWPFEARLAHDYGALEFTYWMRVQTLPGLTLVTLVDKEKPQLAVRPPKGLTPAQLSTVMHALDISRHRHTQTLLVAPDAKVEYADLVDMVHRHAFEGITLGPGSIRAASLPRAPDPGTTGAAVLHMPAAYVPHFLVPHVRGISLEPPNGRFNAAEYDAVLDAIAALPGTQPIALSIALRPGKTGAGLPWTRLIPADPEASAVHPRPPRVAVLTLFAVGGPFRAAHLIDDTTAFPRWLVLFPGLRRLEFACGAVELTAEQRQALAQRIRAAGPGIGGAAEAIVWRA